MSIESEITELLRKQYGQFFEEALLREIAEVGSLHEAKAGTVLIEIGSYVKGIPLLIDGAIKVMKEDEEGDELLLYYLERGETCSVTMSCCLGDQPSEVRAIAEMDTRFLSIPITYMETWSGKYRSWRNFVFEMYNRRLNELFGTVANLAFQKMDERLIHYLQEKARVNQSQIIHSTHQDIAYDLHTSRVVVSRLLKKLENMQKVALHRNSIEILDL